MILTANSYQKSAPSSGKCRNYADFESGHAFWREERKAGKRAWDLGGLDV